MKTKLLQKLVLLIAIIGTLSLTSCGSVKKLKEEKTELIKQVIQKDSLLEVTKTEKEKEIQQLSVENNNLKKEIKEKEESKSSTKTVITLKPEKDENGNIKPSEFTSEKNGVKTSIKINGNGEVTSEITTENTKSKETAILSESNKKLENLLVIKEKEFQEKTLLQQKTIEELKKELILSKVEKKSNNFWFIFWVGFAVGVVVTILLIYVFNKFNLFSKIKNFFT